MEELQGSKVELHCGWKFCKLNIFKLKLRLTLILKDNFTSWTGDNLRTNRSVTFLLPPPQRLREVHLLLELD